MSKVFLVCSLLVLTACMGPRGSRGADGATGNPGTPGSPGTPGESCTVEQVSNGAIVHCGATSAVILNGTDGADGTSSMFQIVDLIDPCGTGDGFNEVLLKLADGRIIAHYSHGNLQFLTLISPGNYQTTDGQHCNFTVNSDMTVSW